MVLTKAMSINGGLENVNMHVLIMGGLGFIGSHICRRLLYEGCSIRIFDKLYGSRHLIGDIENQVEIDEGDAERPQAVIKALRDVDMVIDLVHTTLPSVSMQNPAYDVQSNVISHASWLSQLNKTKIRRIIYISSGGTVYGIPKNNPIKEDHPTDPISSYGVTKLTIEKYVTMYAKAYGIDYRICRPANIYGEGQRLHVGQGVVGVFLERCLKGQPIEIWGDGTVSRDFLYIDDMVEAVVRLMVHEGASSIFNISSGVGYSVNHIVSIIQNELKLPVDVRYMASRSFDVPINILDNSQLKKETGWQPKTDLISGIWRVYHYLNSSLKLV